MTTVLTARIGQSRALKLRRRLARLRQTQSDYIRALIDEDLAREDAEPQRHVFASEDLIGSVRTDFRIKDNATLRRAFQEART